jgi:hypothetical protein
MDDNSDVVECEMTRHRTHRSFRSALIVAAWSQSIVLAQNTAAPKTAPPSPRVYPSPEAAFEAYREAIAKGDARTEYFCQVPELRGDTYQAYATGVGFAGHKPEVIAVVKKFAVEWATIAAEYDKRHKQKYGSSFDKLTQDYVAKRDKALAEYEKIHGKNKFPVIPEAVVKQVGPGPQMDQELLRKLINEKISDKDEFIVAMDLATQDPKKPRDPPGPLKNLRVKGDMAVGTTYSIVRGERTEAGQPTKQFADKFEFTIRFRKTNDGWLVAGEEPPAPLVPRPPPPALFRARYE